MPNKMDQTYTIKNATGEKISNLDQIGSFAGYIRRPKPTNTGYITNFFGENGDDSDVISALSLTKFIDTDVFVSVYLIKDAIGIDMKDNETGKYPLITSFIAKSKRPMPSPLGMTAQFYAENGVNADAAMKLGETLYLDALAYIDIRGKLAINNPNIYQDTNQEDIVENHAWKVSESEKKEYKAKEKKYIKFNLNLHDSDFFDNEKLIYTINDKENYKYIDYLSTKQCCFKDGQTFCECKSTKYINYSVNDNEYSILPFCDEHAKIVMDNKNQNYQTKEGKMLYYFELKNTILVKEWLWSFFIKEFSLTGHEEPNSLKILEWVSNNDLRKILPKKFVTQAISLASAN